MNSLEDVIKTLYQTNTPIDVWNSHVEDESYIRLPIYKRILEEVLKDKPRRVIDVGSNLNQFGYLFASEGIEYIGIDIQSELRPIQTDMIKYICADFNHIKHQFKDDVVISSHCVGFFVSPNFECKRLITEKVYLDHIEPQTTSRQII